MTAPDRPTRLALQIAAAVLLASLCAGLAHLPTLAAVPLPALIAALVAIPLLRRDRLSSEQLHQAAVRQATENEGRLAEAASAMSTLRHDLRGILSPALLTADRLAMSQDPVARRAGEAMISTVERAEARLAPQPDP